MIYLIQLPSKKCWSFVVIHDGVGEAGLAKLGEAGVKFLSLSKGITAEKSWGWTCQSGRLTGGVGWGGACREKRELMADKVWWVVWRE